MSFLSIILLAIALSVDSFGVGLAYGIKKVRISLLPILSIVICSSVFMGFSIVTGNAIAGLVPDHLDEIVGGMILVLISLWQLVESRTDNTKATNKKPVNETILCIRLKAFGIVLQILREPEKADMDKSGEISLKEAILLGIALNIDAMGVGLGAGIAGYSLVLVPAVAVALFSSLMLGLSTGKKVLAKYICHNSFMFFIPGIILMLLGLLKIITNIF